MIALGGSFHILPKGVSFFKAFKGKNKFIEGKNVLKLLMT